MNTNVKKVQTIKVPLTTKPGALCKIYSAFQEAGVNVIASWGYEMAPGKGEAVFYPSDFNKTKALLTELGFKPTMSWACYAESTDKVGAYAEILAKIAKANVNLSATDAFSVNGKFSTMFFAEETEMPALCKALGC